MIVTKEYTYKTVNNIFTVTKNNKVVFRADKTPINI